MDIILLVVVIFSGEGFHSLEIRDYYNSGVQTDISCENYIGSARFRKSLKLTGIREPRVRAACLGTTQLPGFHDLVKGAKTWKTISLNE